MRHELDPLEVCVVPAMISMPSDYSTGKQQSNSIFCSLIYYQNFVLISLSPTYAFEWIPHFPHAFEWIMFV